MFWERLVERCSHASLRQGINEFGAASSVARSPPGFEVYEVGVAVTSDGATSAEAVLCRRGIFFISPVIECRVYWVIWQATFLSCSCVRLSRSEDVFFLSRLSFS